MNFEPWREETNRLTWAAPNEDSNQPAPNRDSNQPAHPRSLSRVFVSRMKKLCILGYPKIAQGRFWSDCANAQADLNLRWAHMFPGTFSGVVAHLWSQDHLKVSVDVLFFIAFVFSCHACDTAVIKDVKQNVYGKKKTLRSKSCIDILRISPFRNKWYILKGDNYFKLLFCIHSEKWPTLNRKKCTPWVLWWSWGGQILSF